MESNVKSSRKRLEWVDIAKAIAIILMVIGHEVHNLHIYAFIFSFHMPLFFILSGYTSGRVSSWSKYLFKLKKSFVHVWLLAIFMIFLLGIENWVMLEGFTLRNLGQSVLMGSIWGSNVPALGINGVGVMWFLIVFFWAKVVFDFCQVILSDTMSGIILVVLSGISMACCQNFSHFLPQALDLVPVGALFMWIGAFIKNNIDFNNLSNLWKLLFLALILIWIICFIFDVYIELSVRHYPYYFLAIIEAVGGTIFTCILAKWISLSRTSLLFQLIGKHTLAIMCIHHLDLYWVNWGQYIHQWPIAVLLRLILDFMIFYIFLLVQQNIRDKDIFHKREK